MHDIDRTQVEYTPEVNSFETESRWGYGETQWSGEVLSESDEAQLAAELLSVELRIG